MRTDTDLLEWLIENGATVRKEGANSPDPYYFVIYRNGTTSGAMNDFRSAIDLAIALLESEEVKNEISK